ncbi:MAG TPA: hypothetical protein DER09_10745 [Prolixibacteraceae bacterium]|nr:hypothetical protein [Prolixibacteraceae bacterium]
MRNRNINGVIGITSVLLWIIVFLPGLTVNSQPYREQILNGNITIQNFLTVMITYTISNVALLCCVAGVIGAATRRVTARASELRKYDDKPVFNAVFTGVTRGFSVYLLLLAGVYAATPDPFSAPTSEQYVRMAGTISLMSFTVNYEPELFQTIVGIAASKSKMAGKSVNQEKT